MEEVGLAAPPQLGGVHVPAHGIGAAEQGHVPVGMVLEEGRLHAIEGPIEGEATVPFAGRAFPLAEDGLQGLPRHGHG